MTETFHYIIENGDECSITEAQVDELVASGRIYRCDECESLDDISEPKTEQRIYHVSVAYLDEWVSNTGPFAPIFGKES